MDDIAHSISRLVEKALDEHASAGSSPRGVNLLNREGQIWIENGRLPKIRFHIFINRVIINMGYVNGAEASKDRAWEQKRLKEPALLRRDHSGSETARRCFGRERPWAR